LLGKTVDQIGKKWSKVIFVLKPILVLKSFGLKKALVENKLLVKKIWIEIICK